MLESTIAQRLRTHGLAPGKEDYVALVTMFVFEGLLSHPRPAAEQQALIRWLLSVVPSA